METCCLILLEIVMSKYLENSGKIEIVAVIVLSFIGKFICERIF